MENKEEYKVIFSFDSDDYYMAYNRNEGGYAIDNISNLTEEKGFDESSIDYYQEAYGEDLEEFKNYIKDNTSDYLAFPGSAGL